MRFLLLLVLTLALLSCATTQSSQKAEDTTTMQQPAPGTIEADIQTLLADYRNDIQTHLQEHLGDAHAWQMSIQVDMQRANERFIQMLKSESRLLIERKQKQGTQFVQPQASQPLNNATERAVQALIEDFRQCLVAYLNTNDLAALEEGIRIELEGLNGKFSRILHHETLRILSELQERIEKQTPDPTEE